MNSTIDSLTAFDTRSMLVSPFITCRVCVNYELSQPLAHMRVADYRRGLLKVFVKYITCAISFALAHFICGNVTKIAPGVSAYGPLGSTSFDCAHELLAQVLTAVRMSQRR